MTWDYVLRLAVVRVGLTPEQFWKLTFTEFALMVDGYYHRQDLQTIQTREIIAMIYNVNRSKGGPKKGIDFMKTFDESQTKQSEDVEIPNESIIDKIKQRYGGTKSGI